LCSKTAFVCVKESDENIENPEQPMKYEIPNIDSIDYAQY